MHMQPLKKTTSTILQRGCLLFSEAAWLGSLILECSFSEVNQENLTTFAALESVHDLTSGSHYCGFNMYNYLYPTGTNDDCILCWFVEIVVLLCQPQKASRDCNESPLIFVGFWRQSGSCGIVQIFLQYGPTNIEAIFLSLLINIATCIVMNQFRPFCWFLGLKISRDNRIQNDASLKAPIQWRKQATQQAPVSVSHDQ